MRFLLHQLRTLSPQRLCAVDHFLFEAFLTELKVYQLNPALVIQADRLDPDASLSSSLQAERQKKNCSYKSRSLADAWRWRKRKIYRSIGKRSFFRIIPFD